MLIKEGAARKPPEARLKGPEKLIKIRRPNHLRPCTHPNLVSNPALGNIVIKLLTTRSKLGHIVFRGRSQLRPSLPGRVLNNKAILLYFTPNSLSKI